MSILPKMILVTGQTRMVPQPDSRACSFIPQVPCLTAGHHPPCSEPEGMSGAQTHVKQERNQNTKRDAGDLRRHSPFWKARCLFLDLGLSSFAAFPLALSFRLPRHYTAAHSSCNSSCEHISNNFKCSWYSNWKPATQGLCELQAGRLSAV